jgi:hypothetical protein
MRRNSWSFEDCGVCALASEARNERCGGKKVSIEKKNRKENKKKKN